MSLSGKRIVITRAAHQAASLAEMLQAHGAEPLLFPCIDIAPPENTSILDNALRNIGNFEWLLLTSGNTVLALATRLRQLNLPPTALDNLCIGAVGERTAELTAEHLNQKSDTTPNEQTAEGLFDALPDMRGKRVLLPQSGSAREVLTDLLVEAGADVVAIEAYRTVLGSGGVNADDVRAADAVLLASPTAVYGLVKRCEGRPTLPAVCIGPTTGSAALEMGFTRVYQPESDYSLAGMLTVLQGLFPHDDQ